MERTQLLELWEAMWQDGNWIPSWPDSLAGLSVGQAVWSPDSSGPAASLCHSIWQEVVHVTFWRQATLAQLAGGESPTQETIEQNEFAQPDAPDEDAWKSVLDALKKTQDAIAAALSDDTADISRIPFHLIHDGYHLGRITQLRALQGTAPKF